MNGYITVTPAEASVPPVSNGAVNQGAFYNYLSAGVVLGTPDCKEMPKGERQKSTERSFGKSELLCAYPTLARARAISSRGSPKKCKQSDILVKER